MRISTYAYAQPARMREHKLEIFFTVFLVFLLTSIFWINRWAAREGFTPGDAMFGHRRIANDAGLRALNDDLDGRFGTKLPPHTRCLNAAEYNANYQCWLELSLDESATRQFLLELCGVVQENPRWTFSVRTNGGSVGSNIRPLWWNGDNGSESWEIRQTGTGGPVTGSYIGGPHSFRFTPGSDNRLWVWVYTK
jgi:hypothetical protein